MNDNYETTNKTKKKESFLKLRASFHLQGHFIGLIYTKKEVKNNYIWYQINKAFNCHY